MRKCRVEFYYGEVIELMAYVIVESMYAACDDSGDYYLMIDLIVDYQKNDIAIIVPDQKVTHIGQISMRKYTVGCQICFQWRDGSTSWQILKYQKGSHPVETAEYAVAQEIYHGPVFNWWVNAVLKKRLRIISLVKKINNLYLKKTHNFGIEVPKSVAQEYDLDENNGNTIWEYSIVKEMKDMSPAFRKIDNGGIVLIGYQCVNFHIIFDVNMEDICLEARFVAGGHVTDPPYTITYTSVVLRETVRIDFTLAYLNDLPVKLTDIKNAYITTPVTEKI